MSPNSDDNWVDAAEVRRRYHFTRDQLNNALQDRTFPAPLMVAGKVRWNENDLREYEHVLAKRAVKNAGRYLNIKMVCERYHVSTRTIENWVSDKVFPPPLKIGRKRMWDRLDLEKYEENGYSVKPKRRGK